jgi:ADP-ribose pyrophosphatase
MKPVWEGIHFKAYHELVEVVPGQKNTFEFVWRIDGTRSIVLNESKEILLTREFRHELQDYDWRLPGGKLDYVDEPIIEAASRELKEETGITAREWRYLFASGILMGSQNLGQGEKISLSWFSQATAKEMALTGLIREEISALSILRYIYNEGS